MRKLATSDKFSDKNFMTPEIIGYWSIKDGDVTRHVEISKGEGISHAPIYGVTVRPDREAKLSRPFWSLDDAMEYLEQIESES